MDKFRAITVFRRVIELGSFKAAAEDLNLSKAAVSKNINELENYLKSPLIIRTTRRMNVTENGLRYYNHVRNILDEMANADLSILEDTQQLRGELRISMPMSFGLETINPAVCQFMKLYPQVNIDVLMSDQYVNLVDQGIDIAIRGGGQLKDSSLRSRKLVELNRVLCASPAYIENAPELLEPDDLSFHNCLIYSLSLSPTNWVFKNENEIRELNLLAGSYVVNNGLALKQAALAGVGVILTPEILVRDELEAGKLLRLLPAWKVDAHALYAVYPYHRETSHKIRTFIDFLSKLDRK
ncbi:transcriptional regulator [Kiloniella spongiae]|uniref:Transcriptional regulator n=1 Tax=Kiloniella spongiae TaxID=1489064 RepID=A0A0H2MHB1_9PROT|nr:LysR family transcriptional regulator [Kiloniella spongiae]KLN61561.1 transcriptional regulator [Kiloniella spongiae]